MPSDSRLFSRRQPADSPLSWVFQNVHCGVACSRSDSRLSQDERTFHLAFRSCDFFYDDVLPREFERPLIPQDERTE